MLKTFLDLKFVTPLLESEASRIQYPVTQGHCTDPGKLLFDNRETITQTEPLAPSLLHLLVQFISINPPDS